MIVEIKNNSPKNRLRIEYMLGNFCNYKCKYCFPGSNEGDQHWPDIAVVKKNLSHLLNQYKKIGKSEFLFYLIGGEPTVWKELPEFCKYFKENYSSIIHISTNGSRSFNWWKENFIHFDQIDISVHHEYAKIEHIKNISDLIYENEVYVNCDVMFDYGYFDKCKQIVEDLKTSKHSWPIISKPILLNGKTFYNEEETKYLEDGLKRIPDLVWYHKVNKIDRTTVDVSFKDKSQKTIYGDNWFVLNNLNNFFKWECNIGVDFIKILPNGIIKSNCQQRLYNLDKDFNLYNPVFKDEFNPKIERTICQQSICRCSSEIVINKRLDY